MYFKVLCRRWSKQSKTKTDYPVVRSYANIADSYCLQVGNCIRLAVGSLWGTLHNSLLKLLLECDGEYICSVSCHEGRVGNGGGDGKDDDSS